jgi:small subunit ribosomal protein S5
MKKKEAATHETAADAEEEAKESSKAVKEKSPEEESGQLAESGHGADKADEAAASLENEEIAKPETVEDVVAKVKGEAAEEAAGQGVVKRKDMMPFGEKETEWIPKTKLGNDVLAGNYKSLEEILEKGELILEPEIVDALIPDIMQEIVYIGGSPGKGGGIRRTATKMTARMHKSGRRFKLAAVAVVGNGNGIVGIGSAISKEHRTALEKAVKNAKLNTIRVRRGCGSWECGCGGEHSIPFKTKGKSGSVQVTLVPAPKGVGMVASDETKKILRLAGINDVWVKTAGKTSTRNNLVLAVFDAIKNLNKGKGDL